MFDLTEVAALLSSVNLRAECHGDDKVPAVDLKFSLTVGGEYLEKFHPDLRRLLFKKSDQQDLVDNTEFGALRFPELGVLTYDVEFENVTVMIGVTKTVMLKDCKIDKFKLEPIEGGSVAIDFRVVAHPSEKHIGNLSALIQQEVDLTIEQVDPPQGGFNED